MAPNSQCARLQSWLWLWQRFCGTLKAAGAGAGVVLLAVRAVLFSWQLWQQEKVQELLMENQFALSKQCPCFRTGSECQKDIFCLFLFIFSHSEQHFDLYVLWSEHLVCGI